MLVVNGCPKTGTHSLMAFLSRIGLQRCPGTILANIPGQAPLVTGAPNLSFNSLRLMPHNIFILAHVCSAYADHLSGFLVFTMLRDPRNVLTSYCRHRSRVDHIDLSIANALEDYWSAGPFIDVYRGYLGWRGKSGILRYEDLPGEVAGDGYAIYQRGSKDWNTRTGSPSDWTETWTCADHKAWVAAGGRELLAEAGYV